MQYCTDVTSPGSSERWSRKMSPNFLCIFSPPSRPRTQNNDDLTLVVVCPDNPNGGLEMLSRCSSVSHCLVTRLKACTLLDLFLPSQPPVRTITSPTRFAV